MELDNLSIPEVLEAIKCWAERQIAFHREHQDVIAENAQLKAKLEATEGTDEYRIKRMEQIRRDREKAQKTLDAAAAEEAKLNGVVAKLEAKPKRIDAEPTLQMPGKPFPPS